MAGLDEQHDNDFDGNAGIIFAIQEVANAKRETTQNNHGPDHETEDNRVMRIQGEFRKTRPPGQAYHWWESVLVMPDNEITTWIEFEKNFLEKYFPSPKKAIKGREFTNLIQRDLTVAEYQARFEELMCFAPEMIPNEANKVQRFEEGLKPAIKENVDILRLTKYVDVVERALVVEQSTPEGKRAWEVRNSSGGQSNKRSKFSPHRYISNHKDHTRWLRMHDNFIIVSKLDIIKGIVHNCGHIQHLEHHHYNIVLQNHSSMLHCLSIVLLISPNKISQEVQLVFDLIILEMLEYDVILGMDWLTHFNAIIDCGKKRVTIKIPDGETFSFHGIGNKVKPKFILDIRECSYLNLITSIAMEVTNNLQMEFIAIVKDFNDVFLEELLELPPEREVEFAIEVYLSTTPISIPPYRMTPSELKELKDAPIHIDIWPHP
ncbi:uncharacterized protein [Pyrus communis]|uniref:uncharacterized protein n=1 Tax=Pyrus communis TaxID=23211 RepID=UPI0035C039C7